MLLKHGSNDQIGSKWIKIGSNFQIGLEWIELTLSKLIELDQTGSNWIKLHQTLSNRGPVFIHHYESRIYFYRSSCFS